MKVVNISLKKQISDAIEDSFLVGATFGTLGFGARTALDVMTRLFLDFGNLTPIDIDNNDKRMKQEYNANIPIEVLFKQIDDAQKFAVAGRSPYTINQLIQCGIIHILRTQVYTDAYREWIAMPHVQHTWVHFKYHFL